MLKKFSPHFFFNFKPRERTRNREKIVLQYFSSLNECHFILCFNLNCVGLCSNAYLEQFILVIFTQTPGMGNTNGYNFDTFNSVKDNNWINMMEQSIITMYTVI